ncbi:DUF881 domain-containing protein [Brevibacillus laterosporus]|uniref:DUF881 domain-containing protein n=1 Tax=Brevibacillus laterosporus TaxID=1465 RepID=A0A502I8Q4_BRELA|nr:DUF881 domain-containing protein [Brevibacillus laterosporus]QDX95169.1 DUF881 domain-containing protein [Brevibacillus laterosporus]RAP26809.1 hypothetical protein C2W64_01250 [Brevibacillus laterosporus]TPG69085.1 DUF881 domain-containing protein [Brevibacillus laterosporus]TPG72671.1 DUF881 domain-containing protein [Brevibacillus laterosporus]TPG82022.1 DUF881 domain-containing protein [Brevibacillus laterosporus]
MLENRKITFILTIISAIIGIMLATQIQSTKHPKQADARSVIELRKALLKEQEKSKDLLADISKQGELLAQYEASLSSVETIGVMKEELNRTKKLAGLDVVEGKGIIIRIENMEVPVGDHWEGDAPHIEESASSLMLDVDLRWLTNELLANGATVIAINNNRLISNSSIRNVGEEIQVDTKTIRLPYEIKALGDPETLLSSMKLEGVESTFQSMNKIVKMEAQDHLIIPPFTGNKQMRFMKPVKLKGDS